MRRTKRQAKFHALSQYHAHQAEHAAELARIRAAAARAEAPHRSGLPRRRAPRAGSAAKPPRPDAGCARRAPQAGPRTARE
jgi:hypothetical protein